MLVAAAILLAATASIFYFRLPAVHYRIPDSFTGWVVVSYLDSGCQSRDGKEATIVVSISEDGIGCTDQEVKSNFIRTKWIVVDSEGEEITELSEVPWRSHRKGVWGHAVLQKNERGLLKEYFYIGTESQLNSDWDTMPIP